MKKDNSRPLVVVSVLCFIQCFNTVGWVKTCATLIPKGAVPEEFEEENGWALAK